MQKEVKKKDIVYGSGKQYPQLPILYKHDTADNSHLQDIDKLI